MWWLVSTLGLSLVSGLGGLLGFYIPMYAAQGYGRPEITALMTYPALFMSVYPVLTQLNNVLRLL